MPRCVWPLGSSRHSVRTELVLLDLRDLTSTNAAGLRLLAQQNADCCARGMQLGLMICSGLRHDQITEVFILAGLGDLLHYDTAPFLDAAHPVTPPRRARKRASRVAAHRWLRRPPSASTP